MIANRITVRLIGGMVLAASTWVAGFIPAFAADEGAPSSAAPNIYLDVRTNYASVPANTLPIGFGGSPLFTALNSAAFSRGQTVSTTYLPPMRAAGIDLPGTVDVTDSVSLYAGISATSTATDLTGWTSPAITSWNVGFQADLYQQNGGAFPTVTLQSTITQSVPNTAFATTTFLNILELDYALNADETRGLLAGLQDTHVVADSALARIHPAIIGYVGAYYQWPSNWKATARAGVQHFGGAQLLDIAPIQPFTGPVVRFDLDRMDDNDNRLFGVTAQITWVPKPSYQLTLRTPLYLVRN